MKVSCDIIRDLLPLYAEDMVSQASKDMVDEHLCECDECVKVLGQIKKQTPIPAEVNTDALHQLKKRIVLRRILTAAAAVMTLITLCALGNAYLFAPIQLTAEQAIEDFYVREDGALVIDYAAGINGRGWCGDENNRVMSCESNRYDLYRGQHRRSIEELYGENVEITEQERLRYNDIEISYGGWETNSGKWMPYDPEICKEGEGKITDWDADYNWWYADPSGGTNNVLLYDAGKSVLSAQSFSVTGVYHILFAGMLILSLVCFALQKLVRRKWKKEILIGLAVASAAVAFSTLFVSAGRLKVNTIGSFDGAWGPMICANAVCITVTLLLFRQLHIMKKQDKGL